MLCLDIGQNREGVILLFANFILVYLWITIELYGVEKYVHDEV